VSTNIPYSASEASGERELRGGELRAGLTRGERRQHQAQGGQGGHGRQRCAGALGVEQRHSVAQRAQQQRDTDDAVGRDHDCGEHRVPCQGGRFRAPGDHQGHDQRDLDHRDRDRQDQRPERLPHPVGDDLGVVHRRQHRTGGDHRHGDHQHDREQ
jgi:hypothetical protein